MTRATAGPGDEAILDGADLQVHRGEVVAIMGANGSGKTSLLRAAAGLLPLRSGSVRRATGRVAYLPQNPSALLHRASVLDEVRFGLAGDATAQALRAIAEMGLESLATRYPRDLSSGQRQRAAIAAILAGDPVLALLDEPTRGMDAAAFGRLIAAVRRLAASGSAVLLATHDRELVAACADRVIELNGGACREVRAEFAEHAG